MQLPDLEEVCTSVNQLTLEVARPLFHSITRSTSYMWYSRDTSCQPEEEGTYCDG